MANVFIIIFILFVHSSLLQDKFQKERENMAKTQIENRGIKDKSVLNAMRKVLRHEMVPSNVVNRAYSDGPLPIGYGQTISQPYIVAFMTEAIKPKPEHKVLEIGTGSGYQAAVLAEIVKEVYTIEIVNELYKSADKKLKQLSYNNIFCKAADGYYGWEEHAPFDAIVVTAAAEHIPPPLVEQLKDGGKMIIPVGAPFLNQNLILVEKKGEEVTTRSLLPVRFVPFTRKK
ncbi:MAG TPA: protein-L-isoaspartate(D-aspartate) O-methyltransferase [Ignavibacteriaceae bacterium]|nr:protein-L-isoaspartate(D-aspartate) O-methyltransferase [Ignavibacteriaceae bacterium]